MEDLQEFPLQVQLSFSKLLEEFKVRMQQSQNEVTKDYLKAVLDYAESYPELINGIEHTDKIDEYEEVLSTLLDNLFPAALTKNEIKAATMPFMNKIFNPTKRFAAIMNDAGEDFDLSIRNLDPAYYYIIGCVVILNSYYNYDIDFKRPVFYEIPDKNGVIRTYRASINADFTFCEPTEEAVEITPEIVDKLIEMGAQIILCDPHRATVIGLNRKHPLKGIRMSSPDIRAGVSLLIAALSAEGESIIDNVNQIDRGYSDIENRLKNLGANIERV